MRVILITGASSGIGAATARALAAPATAIALHARKNRAGLEKVAGFARGAGAEALILEGDLAVGGT
ncbi:MAG TPA: SDR family NAD(P)-dependent oxidoreductase, partial [Reyranella sp.]